MGLGNKTGEWKQGEVVITTPEKFDALADIRREVARECAEIVKAQEIVWIGGCNPEEDTEGTLKAAADAILAKFGVRLA